MAHIIAIIEKSIAHTRVERSVSRDSPLRRGRVALSKGAQACTLSSVCELSNGLSFYTTTTKSHYVGFLLIQIGTPMEPSS